MAVEESNTAIRPTVAGRSESQTYAISTIQKMTSLGEMIAGITYEIQNPFNYVKNFSEVNNELLDEMKEKIENGNWGDVKDIANEVVQNLEKSIIMASEPIR